MDKAEATRLWRKFRANADPGIFERLYRAHRLAVMRYARARIGDEEAAEDVADQVFTYLAVARPPCRGNFESLVIYYARLRCANYRPRPRGQPLSDSPADTPPPALQVEREERTEHIDRALRRLTEEEQEIIVLHLVLGHSLSEVAGITGVPRWTLSRQYRKVLQRLRRILKESEI